MEWCGGSVTLTPGLVAVAAGSATAEPLSLSLPGRQRSAPASTTQIYRKDGRWLLQGGDLHQPDQPDQSSSDVQSSEFSV